MTQLTDKELLSKVMGDRLTFDKIPFSDDELSNIKKMITSGLSEWKDSSLSPSISIDKPLLLVRFMVIEDESLYDLICLTSWGDFISNGKIRDIIPYFGIAHRKKKRTTEKDTSSLEIPDEYKVDDIEEDEKKSDSKENDEYDSKEGSVGCSESSTSSLSSLSLGLDEDTIESIRIESEKKETELYANDKSYKGGNWSEWKLCSTLGFNTQDLFNLVSYWEITL